jgi:NADPH:quinone reductase-like Zn-dependent oxidoreductase
VGKSKRSKLKSQCRKVLTRNGKYISVDDGSIKDLPEYLIRINELFEAGRFKAVIEKCYPLEKIVEVHRHVDTRHKKGNVVITVEQSK